MFEKQLIFDSRQGGWLVEPKPELTFHDCLRAWERLLLDGYEPEVGVIFSANVEGQGVYTIEANPVAWAEIVEVIKRWPNAAILRSTRKPCPACLRSTGGRCYYHRRR